MCSRSGTWGWRPAGFAWLVGAIGVGALLSSPGKASPSRRSWRLKVVPVLMLGAVAGVVIDRFSRKAVLVGTDLFRAALRDYRDVRWLFVPYLIRGVSDVMLAVFTPLPAALLLLFVYGLNTSTGMVVFNSTVQDAVPDSVRGRVFTLLDVTWSSMRLLSLALGGLLVDVVGVRALFWAGGTLLAVAGALGLMLLGQDDLRAAARAEGR